MLCKHSKKIIVLPVPSWLTSSGYLVTVPASNVTFIP